MVLAADSLSNDLHEHLHFWLAMVPHQERRRSRWVMSGEWELECRRLAIALGYTPSLTIDGPDLLLGLPIEIRDDCGVPHLEPR